MKTIIYPPMMLACALLWLPSCASTQTDATAKLTLKSNTPLPKPKTTSYDPELGIASIYTDNCTASGERYRSTAMAAAHKKLPLGSKVRVTNLRNGKTCVVKINDRGPYVKGRIIDLTPTAAAGIGLGERQGLVKVKIERL